MKLVDDKGKLFEKVNLFDLFVVILIIAVIVGAYIKFIRPQEESIGTTSKIEYDLEITVPLKNIHANAMSIGEKVYFKQSDFMIGEIKEIKREQAEDYVADINGDISWALVPNYYNVVLTISANGYKEGKGYTINEIWNANVGATISFSTRRLSTMGTVKALSVLED